jgi:ATP-dependent DNA helicase Q1
VLKSKRLLNVLEKLYTASLLDRVVIDEAHCCSQYGHDFRPDYKKIGLLKRQFPRVPCMALTATCPLHVLDSMMSILNLSPSDTLIYAGPLNRPNLVYSVIHKPSQASAVNQFMVDWILERYAGKKGIVYCLTRKDAELVAASLQTESLGRIRCMVYHASIDDAGKSEVQRRWKDGDVDVVAATIAFGQLESRVECPME